MLWGEAGPGGSGSGQGPGRSNGAGPSAADGAGLQPLFNPQDDDVRAPIPQKQARILKYTTSTTQQERKLFIDFCYQIFII